MSAQWQQHHCIPRVEMFLVVISQEGVMLKEPRVANKTNDTKSKIAVGRTKP